MSFDIFGACPDENEINSAASKTVLTYQDLKRINTEELASWCLAFDDWYRKSAYTQPMNGWLKKIRPIYTKRLRPASREVYRVTGVKKVLSLEKKSVVW